MMELYKRYVRVLVMMEKDGRVIPRILYWDDHSQYPIDRILEIRQSASKVGGCGTLYRCRIQGKERNLFYERNRWFIESTKP